MKTGSFRVALPAAFLVAGLWAGTALAAGDQADLISFDSGRADTARAIEEVLREGDPWQQLDWTFTLRPSLLYRRYLDERGGELLSPRLSATLQVRFGEKPLDTVRRAAKLERALRTHERLGRLEVRNALLAHAELLLAQDGLEASAAALADLGPDSTALEREAASLAHARARSAHGNAQREAAAHGFTGRAVYAPLRFRRAEPVPVSGLSAFRLQELAVAEAELRLLEASGAGMVKDFRLGFGYRTPGTELDVETGLLAGRPGLRVGTVHPGGRERFEFRLSAELAVSDTVTRLPQLEEALLLEQEELQHLAGSLRALAELALEDLDLAEGDLAYAEAELAAAQEELDKAQERLEAVPADASARELASLQTAAERGAREVGRLTTRLHRAWMAYVRRHHDLLEAVEGAWAWR